MTIQEFIVYGNYVMHKGNMMTTVQLQWWNEPVAQPPLPQPQLKNQPKKQLKKLSKITEKPPVPKNLPWSREATPDTGTDLANADLSGKTLEKSGVPGTFDSLRLRLAAMETGAKGALIKRISCGVEALDRGLPGGGLAAGTIVEWVQQELGGGAGWLSLLAARAALEADKTVGNASKGRLVVIDGDGSFYPSAAVAAGIPLDRIVIVRPENRSDGLWAADLALRSPAVSVVWGRLQTIDDREARRLQLAAETGQTLGLWLRPGRALSEPSWADIRWFIKGLGTATAATNRGARRLEARLVRCRGARSGANVTLEIGVNGQVQHVPTTIREGRHEDSRKTAAMPLVAQLAHPTPKKVAGNAGKSSEQTRKLA